MFSYNHIILPKKIINGWEKAIINIFSHFWVSLKTRNRLNRCIRNQLPFYSLRIVLQLKACLSSLFKFKNSIPKHLRSHFIHKFSSSCCKATYYGITEKNLFVWASEHLRITPLTQKWVKNLKKSAITEHVLLEDHNVT